MRVFHFLAPGYGLEDIRRRRLKIATINELNDPFELFGVDLGDMDIRRAFQVMKNELAQKNDLLCFSQNWHNPVQWSHYAAKHTGICLGFDVPDECLGRVNYSRKRLLVKAATFQDVTQIPPEFARELLFTKYAHWRYENEIRSFVTLDDIDKDSSLYFAKFSENLRLSEIIVGAESDLSRSTIQEALGDLADHVDVFKARLAFKTLRVIKQRNAKLWD